MSDIVKRLRAEPRWGRRRWLSCAAIAQLVTLGACHRADPPAVPGSQATAPQAAADDAAPASAGVDSAAATVRPGLTGPISNADAFEPEAPPPREARRQLAARTAPVALTSSDGQGLQLRRYHARAVIDGPLTHCELRLTFFNPERRQREGRFELTLPDRAAIARFAMRTRAGWTEGEVIERQQARRVYEDHLHRREDPALLELDGGNRFSARVFPIEPEAEKEIIVAWSAERSDPSAAWTLPLVGLPRLDELDVRVFVQSAGATVDAGAEDDPKPESPAALAEAAPRRREIRISRRDIQPAVNLEVRPGVLDAGWAALRAGRVAVVRLEAAALAQLRHDSASAAREGAADRRAPAQGDDRGRAPADDGDDAPDNTTAAADRAGFGGLTVALFDTSASGALAFETRLQQLEHLARVAAAEGGELAVLAFDQQTRRVWRGRPARQGGGAIDGDALPASVTAELRRLGPLGASDLGAAIAAVAAEATAPGAALPQRVVVLGDGICTAGERDGARLADRVRGLGERGFARLDIITATAARDDALLQRLVSGQLADDGVVVHAGVEASAIAPLQRRTLPPLTVSVRGADWVWPHRITGLQADGSALVWAELRDENAQLEVEVRSGEAQVVLSPEARRGEERLLERAFARARIALLEATHDQGDAQVQAAIAQKALELALRYRVVSRWTSFLVLESDADYARYGLDRTERAAILTVGDDGVMSLAQRDRGPDAAALGGNKDLLEALGQPPSQDHEARPTDSPRDPGASARSTLEVAREPERRGGGAVGRRQDGGEEAASTLGRLGDAPPAAGAPSESARAGNAPTASHSAPPPRLAEPAVAIKDKVVALEAEAADAEQRPRQAEAPSSPPVAKAPATADADVERPERVPAGAPQASKASGAKGVEAAPTAPPPPEAASNGRERGDRGSRRGNSGAIHFDPFETDPDETRRRSDPGGLRVQHEIQRVSGVPQGALHSALYRAAPGLAHCGRNMAVGDVVELRLELSIDSGGRVGLLRTLSRTPREPRVSHCASTRLPLLLRLPSGDFGQAVVLLRFLRSDGAPSTALSRPRPQAPARHTGELRAMERDARRVPALVGIQAEVAAALRPVSAPVEGKPGAVEATGAASALAIARRHLSEHPSDLLSYVALGRAAQASGDATLAARAYGSLIDLHPGRADIRRWAGNLLESLSDPAADALALDCYGVAVADRPDHPSGWLMRALAEARAGRFAVAVDTLDAGLAAPRRSGNFPAYERTAKELIRVFATAALAADGDLPSDSALDLAKIGATGVAAVLRRHGLRPDRAAGLRLMLTWENDANDVDLHVFDRRDRHAFYRRKSIESGQIFADVTTGWGPECFVTRDAGASLRVFVHSYRQGPMGFGMGRVIAMRSDGKAGVQLRDLPFVVMADRAYVDLGVVRFDAVAEPNKLGAPL